MNETQTLVQQKQSIVLGAFFIFAYFCIENKDEYNNKLKEKKEKIFQRENICKTKEKGYKSPQ